MARVRVSVVDINDNRPVFYPVLYTVSLSTHSSPGTSVVKVTANDPDSGANGRVTYKTVPGGGSTYFTLNKDTGILSSATVNPVKISTHDGNSWVEFLSLSLHPSPSTGVISLSRSLHGKANTVISMVISAEDGGGLTAPANARVNISVVGSSVAAPVFEQAQYFFTVPENVLRGTSVGVVRAATTKTGECPRLLLLSGEVAVSELLSLVKKCTKLNKLLCIFVDILSNCLRCFVLDLINDPDGNGFVE